MKLIFFFLFFFSFFFVTVFIGGGFYDFLGSAVGGLNLCLINKGMVFVDANAFAYAQLYMNHIGLRT